MSVDIESLLTKAHHLQQTGHLKEAIACYQQLLARSPQHIEALHCLGLAEAQCDCIPEAAITLNRALELQPDNAILHNHLANVYKKSHEFNQAITHYQKALHLAPHYAQAHNNLAGVYALQDHFQEALKHYGLAVHAEPDFVQAHYNLGLLLLKHNELAAAKIQFNNVLSLQPENAAASFYLGGLLLAENALDEAEAAFNDVLAHNSEHVEALVNMGVIELKREHGQLAIDYFTKALGFDNHNEEARNNLAATFIHHDRFENALAHYNVLLQQHPHHIEYLYNAGVAQMALGHLKEAMAHFNLILSLQADHFATLNNLAAIHIRLGERDEAITLLQRALLANPTDSASQFMLHALTGDNKNPEACPSYVSNLFNHYALYYDQHLQSTLHYALPQHIGRLLHRLKLNTINHALDLGCGTGLSGIVLRELTTHLTGVDIASKMLAEADKKGIYDKLIESELISFLQTSEPSYDLAIAADVLPYLGELEPLFAALSQRLHPQGFFIFSLEISDQAPWQLQSSTRFSHHPAYINNLCEEHGFKIIEQEKVVARQQNQQSLEVMLYCAQFMAARSIGDYPVN